MTLHTPTGVDLLYIDEQIVTQLSRPGVIIASAFEQGISSEKGAVLIDILLLLLTRSRIIASE